ncbi:MerR family transcriptional regulator [Amycolatopsis taiwanensis]|uniref:Transcriptional regulator n=1 Tax=Amycolatopsis taiwanensis TaxID=342230 RepID=A0A9W6R679_9PSEU|nr:MerR family transcriptional regulator [Amycolatopsis taiwanensis]GLY70189.1 transcriptional regulator [Amycolatopsis taiwanensis]
MDLIPIGEAAKRLGMRTSTLRYYEERDLVRPAGRVNGRRVYGLQEMRRLAFLQIAQRLGIRLHAAAAVLDEASEQWRATVGEQIAELEELISRAQGAKGFLTHALMCPAEHPAHECPHLMDMLDRLLDGTSFEQLAAEHTDPNQQDYDLQLEY